MTKPLVGILMGSDSDLTIMEKATDVLKEMGVPFEMDISSAHRLPDKTADYAKTARKRGIEVMICGAGMASPPRRCCGNKRWSSKIGQGVKWRGAALNYKG
ncbi:MAG TPA: AIR carboxylase family protein [Dissulfurispiraceae bacterium]|nr:AIR carboxylase family protein [Dissulfurispiraceae bacterium]